MARTIAPGIVTAGMPRANRMMTIPPAIAATAIRTSPEIVRPKPATRATTPRRIASRPRPVQRPTTLLGRSTNQP